MNQVAQSSPDEAAQWLAAIGNEGKRRAAAGRLVHYWHSQDPAAAMQWAKGLPAGLVRDGAIAGLSQRWRTPTTEQERLIASIRDPDMRAQAKVRQAYNLVRTEPARARLLLADEEIPLPERRQIEKMLDQRDANF